jgi:hypothetical protein
MRTALTLSLAVLPSLLALGAAQAAASQIALTCVSHYGKDPKPEVFRVNTTTKPGVFVMQDLAKEEGQAPKPPVSATLAAVIDRGPVPADNKNGDPSWYGKFAAFTGQDAKHGYVEYTVALAPNDKGTYSLSARITNGNYSCSAGPAFSVLASATAKKKASPADALQDLEDGGFAAACSKKGETAYTHRLRAFYYGYGEVSLNIEPKESKPDPIQMEYESVRFGRNGALVFGPSVENSPPGLEVQSLNTKLSRLYMNPKPILRNGVKTHDIVFVPDLKSPDQAMVEMSCVDKQAFPIIEKYATEAHSMPKAFPAKPGTMAQQDHSLCAADRAGQLAKYDKLQQIAQKWSPLLMKFPMPDGSYVTGQESDFETGNPCPIIEMNVSNEAGAAAMRATIGRTLEGIEIEYHVGASRTLEP